MDRCLYVSETVYTRAAVQCSLEMPEKNDIV